jgi:hypothetical protein
LAVVLGLSAFAGVHGAAAQTVTPQAPFGGRGPGGGVLEPYEDIIHEKIADVLGISLEDFEAQVEAGATLFDLAAKYGVDFDDVREAMLEGRAEAIKQAVADGVITQEQADWMLQRMGGMGYRRGSGMGACDGTGRLGQRPFGRGRMNRAPLTES